MLARKQNFVNRILFGSHDRNINFDNFYTTHSDENKEYAEDIYKKCKEANLIFKKEIEQFYDSEEGLFLSYRFIISFASKSGSSTIPFLI